MTGLWVTTQQDAAGEWYSTCREYPSLSWFARTPEEAYEGLRALVDSAEADMAENGL